MNYRFIILLVMASFAFRGAAQTTVLPTPAGSVNFGWKLFALPNGNYAVFDPFFSEGGVNNKGAVFLYNGATDTLISTLKGSQADDQIGLGPVEILPNSNFIICSQFWNNGSIVDAGAITFINGTTGLNGVVNSSNSLVSGVSNTFLDRATVLPNGNYIVRAFRWSSASATNAGAVTWGSGTTGVSGVISSANSLVGSTPSDNVADNIFVLSNGNYIVNAYDWDNGSATNAGAVTFCNGTTGRAGVISSANSLVGTTSNDRIGIGIAELSNGNYVTWSSSWQNSNGAATWGSGTTGVSGVVSSANSLVGNAGSSIASGVTALTNGNYVVYSPRWDNGAITDAGAATWCNGTTGLTGNVTTANSLTGNKPGDGIGNSVMALANGNYVVLSPLWDNVVTDCGAVTWCNGTSATSGVVTSANSLTGSSANDQVGNSTLGFLALPNGNYVVGSPNWNNGAITTAGAATWCNGTAITSGVVSSANSLVGGTIGDQISSERITGLSNGNYVVNSPKWHNGSTANAGAVTWGNGTTGTSGVVSSANSLVGSTANDNIGASVARALSNGNYVVWSQGWDNGPVVDAGAVAWGNGTTGTSGVISSANALVGATAGDAVSSGGVQLLPSGNYVAGSPSWDNGAITNVGASTWCNGATGLSGAVSVTNSLYGSTAGNSVGGNTILLTNGNYFVPSRDWGTTAIPNAGAVTWVNGTTGIVGDVSAQNSLVGSKANDNIATNFVRGFDNGHYTLSSYQWDNGAIVNAGAVTWGNGNTGTVGPITSCNSVLGNTSNSSGFYYIAFIDRYNKMIVAEAMINRVSVFRPDGMTLALSLDSIAVNLNGNSFTPLIANAACRLIATIKPNGANPVSGTTNSKVWIESSVPVYSGQPFVARHYQLTPTNNAASATARITLYFTQQEFNDYNTISADDLPANATDAAGKARLRVIKYPGISNDGSGLPGSYTGTPVTLDPADADIVWNNSLGRWEVSMDVTGFSGFFVQAGGASVPLRLLQFGALPENNNMLVNWKTTSEVNTRGFDIERSFDGRNFSVISFVPAVNRPGDHYYSFTDVGAVLLNTEKLYYRLRQTDIDGRVVYSQIVLVRLSKNNNIVVYPNPSNGLVSINMGNKILLHTDAVITDMQGKILIRFTIGQYQETVDVSTLPAGLFLIRFADGTAVKLIKE